MKIYSMTATFGKLEHETLTLNPGLNVIYAPNEWGKSTWCAFLLAMLYGVDTRNKTSKNALAEKDRFAPWSGKPMSGRIDLNWNGRDITVERTTRGRIPLGSFQAYETATGIPVPELTAANCGQRLLGVEQSVFRRAGFIRLADLPVTQDEALRRRLNDLVTTGDESGDGTRLEEGLRELKNRCRLNKRTGLLPQAEAQLESLDTALAELNSLKEQAEALQTRIASNEAREALLLNHAAALEYTQTQTDWQRVREAEEAMQSGEAALETLRSRCDALPPEVEIVEEMEQLEAFRRKAITAKVGFQTLPPLPMPPEVPKPFQGMDAVAVPKIVQSDCSAMEAADGAIWKLAIGLGIGLILLGSILMFRASPLIGGAIMGIGLLLGSFSGFRLFKAQKTQKQLAEKYGSRFPSLWLEAAKQYLQECERYTAEQRIYQQKLDQQNANIKALQQEQEALCPQQTIEERLNQLQQMQRMLNARDTAEKNVLHVKEQYEALRSMVHSAAAPAAPDSLTLTAEETQQELHTLRQEHRHLVSRAGMYAGRMESLGDPNALEAERAALVRRIQKLEDTYAALTLAQQTLSEAAAQLQRRFAPRITQQAQRLFSDMTQGRYDRVKLGEDFGLQSAAPQEDTLHDILWRSDGTIDQLYLALRLAVAKELTPESPLILDDALVRFDDERLLSAIEILKQMAESRQVILFTCQKREKNLLEIRRQ